MTGVGGEPILALRDAACPYCGEPVEATLDTPRDGLCFTEDCPVCCQPIEFRVEVGPDGDYRVAARRENE